MDKIKINFSANIKERIAELSRYNNNFYICYTIDDVGTKREFVLHEECQEEFNSYIYRLGQLVNGKFVSSGIYFETNNPLDVIKI